MFDVRWIRDNPDAFDAGLARRGLAPLSSEIASLDAKRRAAQTDLQELQTRRNEASKQIGVAKKNGENADALIAEVAGIKDSMQALDDAQKQSGTEVESALGAIPNLPSDDVPDGADESANVELRRVGTEVESALGAIPNLPSDDVPDGADESANVELRRVGDRPGFDFAPKEHHELGEALSMMDFQRAAKLSGARFVVLSGALARLERALGQFMLDLQTTEHGYTEINPPALVRDTALFGTGQLPKFGEDLFRTTSDHWLIPTAELR